MRQNQRAPFLTALERARATPFPSGEYVGQESWLGSGRMRKFAMVAEKQ